MIRIRVEVSRKLYPPGVHQCEGASVSIEVELPDGEASRDRWDAAIEAALSDCDRRVTEQIAKGFRENAGGDLAAPSPEPPPAPAPVGNGYHGRGYQGPNGRNNGNGSRSNGKKGKPPANGSELAAWSKDYTPETCGFDMFGSIIKWGRDENIRGRVVEWQPTDVARAYAAALDWLAAPAN